MVDQNSTLRQSNIILSPFYAATLSLSLGATALVAQEVQVIDLSPGHYVSTDLESPFEGSFISPREINDKRVNFQTCQGTYIFVEVAAVEKTDGICPAVETIGPLSMPASEFKKKIGGTELYGSDGKSLGRIADAWISSKGKLTGFLTFGQSALFWPVSDNAIVWGNTGDGSISIRYVVDPDDSKAIDVGVAMGYSVNGGWDVFLTGANESGIKYTDAAVRKIAASGSEFSIGASYDLGDAAGGKGHTLSDEELSVMVFSLGVLMRF